MVEEIYSMRVKLACDPADIIIVNSILDSYDGLGLIRTVNPGKKTGSHISKRDSLAYICIFTTNFLLKLVLEVVDSLKNDGITISHLQVDQSEEVDNIIIE